MGVVKRPILHQCTKFRNDRSNHCGDIAIFVIFQVGGRRYFVFFQKLEANMRHRAKFHRNRLNGCRDMAISRFSKWRPSAILDLRNSNFLTLGAVKRSILQQRTKFRKDGQTVADISRFLWFSAWQQPPSWIFKNSKFYRPFRCRGQYASSCQISSKSVKRLQTYGDLTVFKMAAVRHLGFVKFEIFNGRSG